MIQKTPDIPVARTQFRAIIVLSRFVSIIFHPLFMTTITAVVFNKLVSGSFHLGKWIDNLILYTVLLPFLSILLFRILGLISNARMHKPRDRILPLVATMIFYFLAYELCVYEYSCSILLKGLLLGSSCAIFIILAINFFYKVSVHTTAAAILPGLCIVLAIAAKGTSMVALLSGIVIAVLVGGARWFLGAHTPGQIVLGYIVGIFSQAAAYFLLNV